MSERNLWWLFAFIASTIRLALFLADFSDVLARRPEITTPLTSPSRFRECLYLIDSGISPYSGSQCHQPPLFLLLWQLMQRLPTTAVQLVWIAVDLMCAWMILAIGEVHLRQHRRQSPSASLIRQRRRVQVAEIPSSWPLIVSVTFLFNPFSVLSCVAQSGSMLMQLPVIASIFFACHGNSVMCNICLAFASYLSVHPILLFPPLVLLSFQNNPSPNLGKHIVTAALHCGGWLVALLYLSYLQYHSWQFIHSVHLFIVQSPDLTPNIGLWWYFFCLVFSTFRSFFLFIFHIHLLVYPTSLILRLQHQPLFATAVSLAAINIFKPCPTVADTAMHIALMFVHLEKMRGVRSWWLIAGAFVLSCCMGPAFWVGWIRQRAINSNFFYSQTLMFNLSQVWWLLESLSGNFRQDWQVRGNQSAICIQQRWRAMLRPIADMHQK